MDWNVVEGKWKQYKGKAREKWGDLTDDDMDQVGGKKDRLVGKLQVKYGYTKEQAEKEADDWAGIQK